METTVTTKGQIVIPSSLRRKYGIKVGTRLIVEDDGEKILLWPITEHYIERLQGSLKGSDLIKTFREKTESGGEIANGQD